MIYFNNDYSEGCHPLILERLAGTNFEQTPGYSMDSYCRQAADRIRGLCGNDALDVHFLVGGTQANLTVIAAALRPYQGVIAAESGHINVHETGAIEAAGHKVLAVPSEDGKVTAERIEAVAKAHLEEDGPEHTVQPQMVYISDSTELGTIYTLAELEAIAGVCDRYGLYLFLDGARLGYALTAQGNDITLADLARLCDVFYIGGTKVGALFGEALVISNPDIAQDFRYMIKQRGGMLAKGRLLGLQFDTLLADGLYFSIARRANELADQIRAALKDAGFELFVPGSSNQIFAVLPDSVLARLNEDFVFSPQQRIDAEHRVVRICTSWATTQENVDALCAALKKWSN